MHDLANLKLKMPHKYPKLLDKTWLTNLNGIPDLLWVHHFSSTHLDTFGAFQGRLKIWRLQIRIRFFH
jgi:hypothetical protein